MRLDLAAQAAEIGSVGGTQGQVRGPHGRTLYSHFCTHAQEQRMADFLVQQQRPMTENERRYFRLSGAAIAPPQTHAAVVAGA